ncbi:MAG TPA: HEAT repeat domain-containing protein [Planctomycetota bacterium]|nr:HEAT repeat domain-containing protein [Planctomycetota bacterium]
MSRWILPLPLVAALLCASPVTAAEAPAAAPEAAALAARVAELEREVRKLQALVDADWTRSRTEQADRERTRLAARIDALRVEIGKAGAEAKGSKALAELVALAASPEPGVRKYLAISMGSLPRELVAPTLVTLVSDPDWGVATEAVGALLRLGDGSGCDAAADRATVMLLDEPGTSTAGGYGYSYSRQGFFMAACGYLVKQNDPRGVAAYMRQLQESVSRQEASPLTGAGTYSFAYGYQLLSTSSLEFLNRCTGARIPVPKAGYGTAQVEQTKAAVKGFLAWWQANKEGFKLAPEALAPPKAEPRAEAKPDPARPEQF